MGWTFLLVHYLLMAVLIRSGGLKEELAETLAVCSVVFCGLCFVLAASNGQTTRATRAAVVEIGIPIFLQGLLYSFHAQSATLRLIAVLLLMVPALHLLVPTHKLTRPFQHLTVAFAVLALGEAAALHANWRTVVCFTLCVLFLGAAYLTFVSCTRLTRGVWLMGGGLVAWGLFYPTYAMGWLHGDIHMVHTILDLPRFIVAGGMILSLLDDYVLRAEALALHDPLTGLPNRRLFDIRLDQALRESQLTQTPIACLVIDVDKFKWINDTFGHPVGDGLLQALAKRLSWNLGPRDMLARTGGDEFTAILVEAADEYHIRFIAGAMMAAGCVPVSIQQHLIDVRISIGIAVAPSDAIDTSELHRVADEAMYRAKRRGGGGVAFAHEEMGQIHAV